MGRNDDVGSFSLPPQDEDEEAQLEDTVNVKEPYYIQWCHCSDKTKPKVQPAISKVIDIFRTCKFEKEIEREIHNYNRTLDKSVQIHCRVFWDKKLRCVTVEIEGRGACKVSVPNVV